MKYLLVIVYLVISVWSAFAGEKQATPTTPKPPQDTLFYIPHTPDQVQRFWILDACDFTGDDKVELKGKMGLCQVYLSFLFQNTTSKEALYQLFQLYQLSDGLHKTMVQEAWVAYIPKHYVNFKPFFAKLSRTDQIGFKSILGQLGALMAPAERVKLQVDLGVSYSLDSGE